MLASSNPHLVGVDVASRWIDCSWPTGEFERLPNTPKGWATLVARSQGCVIVTEATGVYYIGVAEAAFRAGLGVRVVNPWQVRAFAAARLSRTKTDKVDALLIREFAERMIDDLPAWYPQPGGLVKVTALVRLADGLGKHGVAAGNRAHALDYLDLEVAGVARSIQAALKEQRTRVMHEALKVARKDELIGSWHRRLTELPGFGDVAALKLIAYSGDLRRFGTGRRFAAYTGLTPRFHQSGEGETVGGISRVGSGRLRSVLYFAALTASRTNTPQGELYRRIVESGKPKKVALVAVANRLARGAWQVCVGK